MADNMCILPVVKIKCPTHSYQEVIRVCVSSDCMLPSPLICEQCAPHPANHRVENIEKFLISFSHEIEQNVRAQQIIYDETIGKKENISLLRWIEDCDNHLAKLRDYIKAQKFQMQADIEELLSVLSKHLKAVQEKSFQEFDEFLKTYQTSVETFRLFKDDVFQLLQKHKHWQNPNVLAAKLMSLPPNKINKAFSDTKRAIQIAKDTNSKSQDFVNHLQLSLKELNTLIDDLPSYSGAGSFQEELVDPFCESIQNFYSKQLHIRTYSPISLSMDNYKMNRLNSVRFVPEEARKLLKNVLPDFFDPLNGGNVTSLVQMQAAQKEYSCHSFHEVNFIEYQPMSLEVKEKGRISLQEEDDEDIQQPYTAFSYIGYNLLALAGKELHLYDMLSKSIIKQGNNSIHRHCGDIISIIAISPLFQPLHLRNKIIFASSSYDSTVILWTLDQNKNLSSFQKLIGFLMPVNFLLDLQNGTSLLTADASNEISLLEYHNYKWCFSQKLSKSKVVAMKLSHGEQVIICFEDGQISILKLDLQYNSSSSFSETIQLQTGISGVSSFGIIPEAWEIKTFFVLGCKDGAVRVFDINQKQVVTQFQSSSGVLIDSIIIRESKKCAFSVIFCEQNSRDLYAYHFAVSNEDKVIIEQQMIGTISEAPCFSLGQSKMQVIPSFDPKSTSPLLLILSDQFRSINLLSVSSPSR